MSDPDGIRGPAPACRGAVPGPQDAVAALRSALARGDEDWTYAVALEVRDRLREALSHRKDIAATTAAWAECPDGLEPRWHVLLAAFVGHEFEDAGLRPPEWTAAPRLLEAWVLGTPRLTETVIRAQTPAWLGRRNIFIAEKDLGTL